jgi:hypothetical protein
MMRLLEDCTLRENFNHNKVGALKTALKLESLISDIVFDDCFGDVAADDEHRPLRALKVARELSRRLLSIECIKIIIANEKHLPD